MDQLQDISQSLIHVRDQTFSQFQRIPGSAILIRYIKSSYQNDPVRSAIELFLILFAIRYLLAPKYSTQKANYVKLTEEEVDELCEEWTPEPLVTPLTDFEQEIIDKAPIIVGQTGPKVKLTTGRTVSNFASYNFYNFNGSTALQDSAINTLRTYGVGPCGPPGFYGTQDVHMMVERNIADFLGTPQCIVYAQAFSTISSVIPAFAKRGDIIVADRKCNYAIQKGLQISRSTIRWYEHEDMEDLERVLQKVDREMKGRELTRRFIITEGIFEDGGDISDVPSIVSLKFKYKYRLILDESISFGLLGATGRGATEHHDVPVNHVDMLIGSLATTFAAGGGFCAGTAEICEHQRICGTAYVFSAALPAMLATTASETIKLLNENPETYLNPLRENINSFRSSLAKSDLITAISDPLNPIVTMTVKLKTPPTTPLDEDRLLQDIVDECIANSVLVTRIKRIDAPPSTGQAKWFSWQPIVGIRACISTGFNKKECEKAASVIRNAVSKVAGKRK